MKLKSRNLQSGQVMIASVIFFLGIGLAILTGVSQTTLRDLQGSQNVVKSRESYAVAEALHEDVLYRLQNGMNVSATENLTLNGYTASTTVTDVSGGKQVTSTGDRDSYIKKVSSMVTTGMGVSFNYGVQAGEGGIELQNSSSILGNVYSNGPVTGSAAVNNSNAASPGLSGSATVSSASAGGAASFDFSADGRYAYVLSSNSFQIVDLNNPTTPTVVGSVTTNYGSNPYHNTLVTSGNYLYITSLNSSNLDIYNITSPTSPTLVMQLALGGSGKNGRIANGYLYIPLFNSTVTKIVNISNPTQAAVVGTISTVANPVWVTINGNYLYIGHDLNGNYGSIYSYTLGNPASPTYVGVMPAGTMYSRTYTPYIAGQYMYVMSYILSGMYVLSLSNPAVPTVVYATAANSILEPQSIDGGAGYLYVGVFNTHNTSQRSLDVWSLANPALPVKVSTTNISSNGGPNTVKVKNGAVFVLNGANNASSAFQSYGAMGSGGNTITGTVVSAGSTGSVTRINAAGTAGSMYAKTITDSVVTKDAYYQTITGSSVGGVSYPGSANQATSSMPISEATIDQWETDAAAGGVLTTPCPYKITSTVTLGPVKINCDLELSNNGILNLSGMVWVKGNVFIKNSATINISPSISGRTAAVIADNPTNRTSSSKVELTNTSTFLGSGNNSYVMVVSRNKSASLGGGEFAIKVGNSISGKLLVYAPSGMIEIENSASLKEATGWKLRLKNSASVTYESGLANLLFTSGPSGGYQIDSWQEVQ
ncbi:MAG: hypothetical protein AAB391_00600 [Patescibacteria group bacterium]